LTILPHISPDIPVVGLSSEFDVSLVLKGDSSLKSLVVHHYRLAKPEVLMMNAPSLIAFDPLARARYMLFLKREPDGRYAPLGQMDPGLSSILQLKGSAWDKMSHEDFKKWLDAQRWLSSQGTQRDFGKDLSPEIPTAAEGDGSLHEAAFNGKLEKAKALINDKPSLVFDQNSYGQQSPLHLAVEYGHKDVAELLLANKADLEAHAYGGWTPLLDAVFGGHKDLVELLIEHQANANFADNWGRTPLHVAAENSYTDIAALLLEHNANPNVINSNGWTPLCQAAATGCKELVEVLLDHNADASIKDKTGQTPLDLAVKAGHTDVADLLRTRPSGKLETKGK
jgi:ankyrin repeat protein